MFIIVGPMSARSASPGLLHPGAPRRARHPLRSLHRPALQVAYPIRIRPKQKRKKIIKSTNGLLFAYELNIYVMYMYNYYRYFKNIFVIVSEVQCYSVVSERHLICQPRK